MRHVVSMTVVFLLASVSYVVSSEPLDVKLVASRFDVFNGRMKAADFGGRPCVHLARDPKGKTDGAVAFPKGLQMTNGTIEIDIASESFAGIALRGKDGDNYEKFYFRPFNSGTKKHKNSMQYSCTGRTDPAYKQKEWSDLREKYPGKYEGGVVLRKWKWFHVRIVLNDGSISVYVNDNEKPAFEMEKGLSGSQSGRVGIWSWNAYFANLKLTPTDPP